MIPLIAGMILASVLMSSIGNIYTTDRSTKAHDKQYRWIESYQNGAFEENARYFNDYMVKHHIANRAIKYPYRAGYNYDLSKLYGAQAGLYSNALYRANSGLQAGASAGRSAGYLYGSMM